MDRKRFWITIDPSQYWITIDPGSQTIYQHPGSFQIHPGSLEIRPHPIPWHAICYRARIAPAPRSQGNADPRLINGSRHLGRIYPW